MYIKSETRKVCKQCGMEYITLNADAALHKWFHAMDAGGVDLSKVFVDSIVRNRVWVGERASFIVAIAKNDSLAAKHKARMVLEAFNSELSALLIGDD